MNQMLDCSGKYIDYLISLKEKMSNLAAAKQDEIWVEAYNQIMQNGGFSKENLPFLLALIHPDFYFKNNKSFSENMSWWKSNSFTKGITETSRCEIGRVNYSECVFNKFPEIKGKCQADHFWPNSLGGPSILENRLIICRFHNAMKSNDIHHFNWSDVPTWLKSYLLKIYHLKV